MSSNWIFLAVVLSSVLVHIGLASNSPHGKLCFIHLSCKPSSARQSARGADPLFQSYLTTTLSQVAKITGSVQ